LDWVAATVVSFGQNYEVQLPTSPKFWSDIPPAKDCHCIVLAGETIFFRVNSAGRPDEFRACYVAPTGGSVLEMQPKGILAYALAWEIVTPGTQTNSQSIVKYQAS
jgi:hypothetical protein